MIIPQTICAFIGTVCFSVIFRVASKHSFYCGLNGAFAWIVYSLCLPYVSVVTATFCSCLALTIMARFLSVKRKAPATVFLVTGIFVLVPGAGLYNTVLNVFMGRPQEAYYHGMLTLETALAIAFGIVVAYIPPQRVFNFKFGKNKA